MPSHYSVFRHNDCQQRFAVRSRNQVSEKDIVRCPFCGVNPDVSSLQNVTKEYITMRDDFVEIDAEVFSEFSLCE